MAMKEQAPAEVQAAIEYIERSREVQAEGQGEDHPRHYDGYRTGDDPEYAEAMQTVREWDPTHTLVARPVPTTDLGW